MSELEDLRSFVEVIESGGFNRAARRLGVSKSIVSRRIARLEAELGVRLVARSTHIISATEIGLQFKERCERILADLQEARETIAENTGEVAGRLRLSAPVAFGLRHVVPLLTDLAGKHPRLELDVSYSDRIVDLVGERFDAAIRVGALPDSELVARQIAQVRVVLAASPDYLRLHGRPEKPEDLLRHQCLAYTSRTSPNWRFRVGKRELLIRPPARMMSDNGEAILQWAIAGLGIGEFPAFLVSDAIERGQLEPLLEESQAEAGAIYVVRPPGPYLPAKVRVLIDAMVERFGGVPVWDRCLADMRARGL